VFLSEPTRVVVSARLVFDERCRHRMLRKVVESTPEVVKQQLGETPAEAWLKPCPDVDPKLRLFTQQSTLTDDF
jgi:hypothetical protein